MPSPDVNLNVNPKLRHYQSTMARAATAKQTDKRLDTSEPLSIDVEPA